MKKKILYNEQSVFRFHYLHFGVIGQGYGMGLKELHNWTYTPFMIPKNLSAHDAFMVLSYLIQKVEEDLNEWECSPKCIAVLNNNLEKFGFTMMPEFNGETVDLYTVTGSMRRFKRSEFYKDYFEWFTSGLCLEEVKFIFMNNKMKFEEPNFTLI